MEKTSEKSPDKTSGLAIASMVLGIISIPLLFIYLIGLVFSIASIVLGIVAITKINKNKQKGKGMAIAGIVTGGFTILLFILLLLLSVMLYSAGLLSSVEGL